MSKKKKPFEKNDQPRTERKLYAAARANDDQPYYASETGQPRSHQMTEQMQKASQNLMHLCEEMNNFTRTSIEANLRSVNAAAKGWDESSRSASNMMQENLSRMMSVGKTFAEAKSVQDVISMQQDFMKDCMDLWMASTTRLSEISARTAKDVVEPVAQNANDAITRIMQKSRNNMAA